MMAGSPRVDLELRHCRVLVAVADGGGVTRAARILGVAQSTVSEALLALERIVGAPVTVRDGSGAARLSPVGQALLPHARRLLAAAEAALAAATAAAAGSTTRIAIGAVESISSRVLPAPLRALRAKHPEAEFQVTTGICDDLKDGVARGRLDLALVLAPADAGRVEPFDVVPLAPARMVLVAGSSDPLAGPLAEPVAGRGWTPRDLAARTLILADVDGTFHELLRRWFRAADAPTPRLESAGSLDGVRQAVLGAGGLLGVLPAHAVADDLGRGALAEVATTPPLPGIRFEGVLPRDRPVGGAARELLAALRDLDLTGAAGPDPRDPSP
ncbi:MAG TPA: LysR family transcriptional regulator [Azospirillaceae bacterium]|nr:LysR family transcriptional regulator [Azospirillaceae bacterium]